VVVRLVVVSPGFPSYPGPFNPAVVDTVAALAEVWSVEVHAVRSPLKARGRTRYRGIDIVDLGDLAAAGGALVDAARTADIVWALWPNRTGGPAFVAARAARRPLVFSLMGSELADLPELGYGSRRNRRGKLRAKAWLRSAARVTVGSEWLAEQALRLGASRVDVVPLGAPIERIPRRGDDARCGVTPLRAGDHAERRVVDGAVVSRAAPDRGGLGSPVPGRGSLGSPVPGGGRLGSPVPGRGSLGSPVPGGVVAAGAAREPASPGRILVVADSSAVKRPDVVAEVARGHRGPMTIYGADRSGAWAELAKAPNVTWRGFAESDEVYAAYGTHDVLLHPSAHESQGMALIEAAAAGLPIVCRQVGVAAELHRLGARVEVVNQAFGAAVARVLQDPGGGETDAVRAAFSVPTCTARWRALFEGLALGS